MSEQQINKDSSSKRTPAAEKRYLENHQEEKKARDKEWATKNKEKIYAASRKWVLSHPEKVKAWRKKAWKTNSAYREASIKGSRKYIGSEKGKQARQKRDLKGYGLEIKDAEAMLLIQNSKCAICKKIITFDIGVVRSIRACVDHDHVTGKVRGLLCNNCNTGLGRFGDCIDTLQQAILYLQVK